MWSVLLPIILRYSFFILASLGIFFTVNKRIYNFERIIILVCITIIIYVFFNGYWNYKKAKLMRNRKGRN